MGGGVEVGETSPDFTLPCVEGTERKDHSLTDYRGRKIVLAFYPGDFTPGCTKQACDFSDSIERLQDEGYTVLGISPDKPAKLAKFRERDALTISLLSDPEKDVLRAWGAFGEKKLYGKVVEGVIRSTFVIGADGANKEALVGEDGNVEPFKGGDSIEPALIVTGKRLTWADGQITHSPPAGHLPLPPVTWRGSSPGPSVATAPGQAATQVAETVRQCLCGKRLTAPTSGASTACARSLSLDPGDCNSSPVGLPPPAHGPQSTASARAVPCPLLAGISAAR